MSIDVEDYFHVSVFDGIVPRVAVGSDGEPGRARTRRGCWISSTSSTSAARSSCSGWVGERHPDLVRTIARRGHEIASHGYAHRLIYDQTPRPFARMCGGPRRCSKTPAAAASSAIARQATRSRRESLWALDVLIEEGYWYDSSIFPIRHDRYGIPVSPRGPVC